METLAWLIVGIASGLALTYGVYILVVIIKEPFFRAIAAALTLGAFAFVGVPWSIWYLTTH